MQIKLLVGRAGCDFSQSPGEVVEVGEVEGNRLIAAGQAVSVIKKETASKKPAPEKAVKE